MVAWRQVGVGALLRDQRCPRPSARHGGRASIIGCGPAPLPASLEAPLEAIGAGSVMSGRVPSDLGGSAQPVAEGAVPVGARGAELVVLHAGQLPLHIAGAKPLGLREGDQGGPWRIALRTATRPTRTRPKKSRARALRTVRFVGSFWKVRTGRFIGPRHDCPGPPRQARRPLPGHPRRRPPRHLRR